MIRCTRCCLNQSLRIVNIVVNFCGAVIIIYSLWLLKKWGEAVAELGSSSAPPKPWFVYTCLVVGIVMCLSMLFGHTVANGANGINVNALSMYILAICFILLLQVGLVVVILFKMNWEATISEYSDGKHNRFKNFLILHLLICRLIGISALFAQANTLMLAIAVRAMGPEPTSHDSAPSVSELRYSFLLTPESLPNLMHQDQHQ
ncbi:tetraspanin-19-like [Tasmannia lanceolata]|uniref:tetraspanin-19-like n=1 Tax=Tasmannia lanceolata TaxID=3420 RepID=UPI00406491BD